MVPTAALFEFDSYFFDQVTRTARFSYSVILKNRERLTFNETLKFPEEFPAGYKLSPDLLDRGLYNLHLILGISYWKMHCSPSIVIKTKPLSQEQAVFWNRVYTKGLGEFFYRNKIDYRNLINFPYANGATVSSTLNLRDRALVGVGGGKDSIVTIEQLKKEAKPFDGFVVETGKEFTLQQEVISLAGIDRLVVRRILDPQAVVLNAARAVYNGHVPVSAIYAFIGFVTALLYNYREIIVSNESSSDEGNVEYMGEIINHQWSKSSEFEKLFNDYVAKYLTPSFKYISHLRTFTELQIAKMFTEYKQYFPVFSSCNRLFRQKETTSKRWCGECPKCAFGFIALAAFLPKKEVIGIFGKDLLADELLIPVYRQLLGLDTSKPFECVGTYDESRQALQIIKEGGEYKGEAVITMFEKEYETSGT